MGRTIYAADRFQGKDADASLILARVQDSKTACMRMHEEWMYNLAFVRGGKNQWAYRSQSGRIQELPEVPWRTRMTDIWGYSDERVDIMEANRAGDALNASLANPFQVPPTPSASGSNVPA